MAIKITYRRTSRLSMRIAQTGDVHVSAPYGLPKEQVLDFIEKNRQWIDQARQKTRARQQARADFYNQLPLNTRQQFDDAVIRLKAIVEPMVERYARLMNVSPSALYYKPTISRWGMCNVRDASICFSVYLLLLPTWCVEHVVVHELAHLLEPSHNGRFHAIMDRFFPRWREARKETRKAASASRPKAE